jgi:hypothetical protein
MFPYCKVINEFIYIFNKSFIGPSISPLVLISIISETDKQKVISFLSKYYLFSFSFSFKTENIPSVSKTKIPLQTLKF